jgi:hypothetical protein
MTSPRTITKRLAKREMVVNFAVKDHGEPATVGEHRLMACRREVNNRQSPMRQRAATLAFDPDTRRVGSTVGNRIGHGDRDAFGDTHVAADKAR